MFQQFLREGYEKRLSTNQTDVVETKRKKFGTQLTKAHDELQNKSYSAAAGDYYNIISLLKTDPYPDEFQLSPEAEYAIKCCFCYSSLMSEDRFQDEVMSDVLLDVIKELNDKYRTKLFPMYFLILLNFHRKDWLATLTWCDEVAKCTEIDFSEGADIITKILPSPELIKFEAETCEEIAFFGYGQKITRNTLLLPRLEKYKDWVYNLNDYIASKIILLKPPVSEAELHIVFHREIFPFWCMVNATEYESFYNEKFSTKCPLCVRAKIYNAVKDKNENVSEDKVKLEKYVDQCAQFYQIFSPSLTSDMPEINGKFIRLFNIETKNSMAVTKPCSISVQTDKVKTNHKSIQTEVKKSTESPPASDPQVLSTLLDIKNKYLSIQEKKDETISKLNRKISDLHEKFNKENNTKKTTDADFERKSATFKFEIQKLKEKLAISEKKCKAETEKNVNLQKSLTEYITQKYNDHKQRYKMCEDQARYMITYLTDLHKFLTAKSIPNDKTCKTHIEIWQGKLQSVQQDLERFNTFYQGIRTNMLKSGKFETIWPDPPEPGKLEDNLLFGTFKGAIKNIIQIEEQLYWKYSRDCQAQSTVSPMVPFQSYGYNTPRPQPTQNVYMGPRLVYSNTPAPPAPVVYQTQLMPVQNPGYLTRPAMAAPVNSGLGKSDPRMSKSVDFLDKTVGANRPGAEDSSLGAAGASGNVVDEKEMILLDYVLEQCPGSTEEDITLALLKVMEDNKGTLSNIPKDHIVTDVQFILRVKKKAGWDIPNSPNVDWDNDESANDCVICLVKYTATDKYTLDCHHEYHKKCIKKWLEKKRECPICRVHSVFKEDFPPLANK